MAFSSQQQFNAELDGVTAKELNRVMNRTLSTYEDRKKCIEETLEGTEFFNIYFEKHFPIHPNTNDFLSLDINVPKILENYASYLLNSSDLEEKSSIKYKFYYDESEFQRALKKDLKYDGEGNEVIDFLLANQSNYKKAKDQKITKKDLTRNDECGKVLREYSNYIETLENAGMKEYQKNRLKGEVQRDMILAKDSLMKIHGYNLRYFSESTEPNLEVFDFADVEQLKGYSLKVPEEISDKNHAKIDGLLRMKFNGDFQNDFQCILYDLDILVSKTNLTERERECLNYYRNGLTNVKIGDIIGIRKQTVKENIDRAIKKISEKAMQLQWR